jgi:hypothetical protein
MDLFALWANSYLFRLGLQLGHYTDLRVINRFLFFGHRLLRLYVWTQTQTPFLLPRHALLLLFLLQLSFEHLFLFQLNSLPTMHAPEKDTDDPQHDDREDHKDKHFLEIDADKVGIRGFRGYID